MLNYILPPIIIIISLSILILFLFRKVQEIPAQQLIDADREKEQEKGMAAKVMPAVGQFGLKILERLMHKSKLLSLKFHNISNDWFHSIQERRRKQNGLPPEGMSERRKYFSSATSQAVEPIRPLVREAVVRPQPMVKEKNQLEEALIKRIAINPKDIEAYERLGDYYLESRNYRDSLECFKQVMRLSPSHHKARLRIRRIEKMMEQ